MPSISVIIPLFDKAHTIERALTSVLGQSFADFELIVVDDGSRDGGGDLVAAQGDPRIRLVRQANAGPGAARNHGAALASGQILSFLDADDAWRPGYLQAAHEILSRLDGATVFASAYAVPGDGGGWQHPLAGSSRDAGLLSLPANASPHMVKSYVDALATPCLSIRRDTFLRYGGFFDAGRALFGEDSYLLVQLLLAETVHFDPRPLVDVHAEDSAIGYANRGRQPIHPALLRPARLFGNVPPARHVDLAKLLALYRLRFSRRLASAGRWRDMRYLATTYGWPRGWRLRHLPAELRNMLRCLLAMAGFEGQGPSPDFSRGWVEEP